MGERAQGGRKGSSYRAHAVASGIVNGLVNAVVSGYAATLLWKGFRFDWFVHHPEASFERGFVALDVGVGLLVAGVVVGLIATALAYLAFDKRHLRGDPGGSFLYPEGTTRNRQVHAVLSALGIGVVLAVVGSLNALVVFFVLGTEHVDGATFFRIKVAAGAVGGFVAGAVATTAAATNLAAGRVVPTPKDENLLAKVSLFSARRAGATVTVILVVTAAMAVGVGEIHTDVDVADVLPRGNHNTEAAHNLTKSFKSAFTQQVTLQFTVDPDGETWAEDDARFLPNRRTEPDSSNVTDEVYVRAIDQAVEFMKAYEFEPPESGRLFGAADEDFDPRSPFVGTIHAAEFYRLINWTMEGGRSAPRSAYALPGTDPAGAARYDLVHRIVWAAIPDTVDAVISPDYATAAILLLTDPQEKLSSKEIGERAIHLRDAYVQWAEANPDVAYQVFTGENKPLLTVDLPVANAHSSELTEKDFKLLLPLIAYFIILTLFVAFRSATSIVVTFSSLTVGIVWTFGAMGFMDIALNTLNLTTVPLIMGVGIDYGIHMTNEWQHHRAAGRSNEDAFRLAGGRGALAMLVATITTVGGLFVMVVSPSRLVAELGLLSAIAIASTYILTITFIPAAITLSNAGAGRTRSYRPSVLMSRLAGAASRGRLAVALVVVLLSVSAYGAAQSIGREEFGDPARNYLPDDPLRIEHEEGLRRFYAMDTPDVKANVLVFEGNVTTPESHRYMDAVEASLRTKDLVISDTLRTLPFIVRTYLTVRDGATGAGGYLALEGVSDALAGRDGAPDTDPYPTTRAEIEALLEECAETPLIEFQNLFIDDPRGKTAIMVFSVKAASYEDAERVWDQVWAAVDENEETKPADVRVAFVGNTATNYLFVAEQVPWLAYMTIASAVLVFALVLAFTRKLKPAVAVITLNLVTGLWWVGILPSLDIGLAITLTLPIVFIFCIGSDYALHLAMNAERTKNIGEVYATTGKGVLFSFLTTLGAFAIFTRISNLAVRETMTATALAIAVIFIATVLLVPVFYPMRRRNTPVSPEGDAKARADGEGGVVVGARRITPRSR